MINVAQKNFHQNFVLRPINSLYLTSHLTLIMGQASRDFTIMDLNAQLAIRCKINSAYNKHQYYQPAISRVPVGREFPFPFIQIPTEFLQNPHIIPIELRHLLISNYALHSLTLSLINVVLILVN